MSTEETRSMGGENSKDEVQKIDNNNDNNGDSEKNSDFEFSDGNTYDGYSDDDDDYISDDEPQPKPEPRLWVVRKYHKDDKEDYFDDFRLDCDHEFVVQFSPAIGRPNIPKRDYVYDCDGSYMSEFEDCDDFVLPPYLYNRQFQLASALSIDDATNTS